LKELERFYRSFYEGKRKKIPKEIANILTPLALATWVMDDGCFDRNTIILNTHNFGVKEIEILRKVMSEKFKLRWSINKDRTKWRMRLRKNDFPQMKRLIEKYIIPSMRYKMVGPYLPQAPRLEGSRR